MTVRNPKSVNNFERDYRLYRRIHGVNWPEGRQSLSGSDQLCVGDHYSCHATVSTVQDLWTAWSQINLFGRGVPTESLLMPLLLSIWI